MAETWLGLNAEFRGTVTIAGLPDAIATVPAGATGPDDVAKDAKAEAWQAWGQQLLAYRSEMLKLTERYPEFRSIERKKCAQDPLYMLAVYGYLYEPRKRKGRGGYLPWIPFERQAQLVRWFQWVMTQDDENADGVVSKARDMGASWTMGFCFMWSWLFTEPFNSLWVSWKEDYVDSRMPRAIFYKIDQIMKYLPFWLLPSGYVGSRHRVHLFMSNPENGNTQTGESTTSNSGRGDRVTAAGLDEAAQVPGLMNVWTGLADTTDHRFAISTESMEQGDDFYNLGHGIDMEFHPSLFTMDWWENPTHDSAWYEKQTRRYAADPEGWEREVMRNPITTSQFVYPNAREKFPVPDLIYRQGNPLYVSIDPGFEDAFAMVVIQQNVADGSWDVLGGYTNNKEEAAFYGPLITGSLVDLVGNPLPYEYDEYELEIIRWMAELTNGGRELPKYIGDTYGDNKQGASADSWYSVWRRNHGVRVNADRLPNGKVAAYRMQARTHVGRRKAMRWIMPKLRFGDSIGARQALIALQNNKFPNVARSGKIPESGMLRDKTTHYTSALEYWAVNLQMQDQLTQYSVEREQRMAELRDLEPVAGNRLSRLGGRRMQEVS